MLGSPRRPQRRDPLGARHTDRARRHRVRTAEEQLRSAARQMLLAGALATRARAGYYGARHRRTAGAMPESVLVGTARPGR
ncbi:hypothetical protein STENM223S_02731 [Streptomyces tendae]